MLLPHCFAVLHFFFVPNLGLIPTLFRLNKPIHILIKWCESIQVYKYKTSNSNTIPFIKVWEPPIELAFDGQEFDWFVIRTLLALASTLYRAVYSHQSSHLLHRNHTISERCFTSWNRSSIKFFVKNRR